MSQPAATEEHWDGDVYVERPGTREMAKLNGTLNIPHGLEAAGIPASKFKSLDLLEVGAGVGTVTPYLADAFHSVFAIEPSPSMLRTFVKEVGVRDNVAHALYTLGPDSGTDFASRKPLPSPTAEDSNATAPAPVAQYDVAITTLVVHHVDVFKPFFAGVLSVLKPGGVFLAVEFTHDEQGKDLSKDYHLQIDPSMTPVSNDDDELKDGSWFRTCYTIDSLGGLLKRNGFTDVGGIKLDNPCPAFGFDNGRGPVPAIAVYGRKPL